MSTSSEWHDLAGRDLREVIQKQSDATAYNGSAFVAWNAANHAAVTARTYTETVVVAALDSRYVPASFPVLAAGQYLVTVWDNGANAALDTARYSWDGTTLYPSEQDTHAVNGVAVDEATADEIADSLAARATPALYVAATGYSLDLFRGDSYATADGRGISIVKSANETHWPDTLSTVHLTAKPSAKTLQDVPAAASLTDIACTVDVATGDGRGFTVQLTAAQMATLDATNSNGYRFWLRANKDTALATLRAGTMNVLPDPTA